MPDRNPPMIIEELSSSTQFRTKSEIQATTSGKLPEDEVGTQNKRSAGSKASDAPFKINNRLLISDSVPNYLVLALPFVVGAEGVVAAA